MLYSLIFTVLLSFIFIKLIITYAHKLNLTDIPNERSAHRRTVPLGAGIGFIVAMMMGVVVYDIHIFMQYWYLFAGIVIVLLVGILDDMYDAGPKTKIYVIFSAVFLLWWNGISINTLGSYFGHDISLGWVALPFTAFALVAFTNALNLIDGIDGLAGIISLVIISSFGYIGYEHSNIVMMTLSAFTIASLSAFMVLNYPPAKIFMGDSGSLSLGFIIAVLAILSIEYVHPVIILYLTALPILDTLVVIIRRVRRGVSILNPDKTHIHHILLKYIGDKNEDGHIINGNKRTVLVLTLFQLLFTVIGLMISDVIPILALVGFGIIFALAYIIFTKIEKI